MTGLNALSDSASVDLHAHLVPLTPMSSNSSFLCVPLFCLHRRACTLIDKLFPPGFSYRCLSAIYVLV